MTTSVVTTEPSASIVGVAELMRDSGRHVIPVCEKGKFIGLVTERDIGASLASCGANPDGRRAGELANSRHPMVSPGVDMMEAAKLMAQHGVQVLPVAINGRLLGLLTLDDLAGESMALAAMVFAKATEH
jgi:CBS domain-containing protein